MKIFYKFILFVCLYCVSTQNSSAQKNIKLNISQLRLSGLSTGCDGIGAEEPRWYFTNDKSGTDWCDEESSSSSGNQTWAKNNDIFNESYICPSDIPATISVRMRACENDGASCWTLSSCDGGQHDHSESITTTATNGTYTNTNGCGSYFYTDNHGGCGDADYGYTIQMIVSGSWQTTKNQNASGNITNTTCLTAIDITSGIGAMPTNDGWRGPIRGHIKRCGDIYYKFNLTTNVSYFEIDMFNGDGDVDVYYMNTDGTCGCAVSNDAGIFDYDFKENSPKLGWYVIKLRNGSDYVDIDFRTGGGVTRPGNDNISCATLIGTGGTIDVCESGSLTSNNINATDEDVCGVDEPQENDNRTVWYKFVAGSTIGTNLKIKVTNNGGDNMTPDIALFKQVTTPGLCPTLYGYNTGLQYLADNSGTYLVDNDAEVNITSCSGAYTAGATYFLQIDDEGGTAGIGYYDGDFKLEWWDNGKIEGQNYICSAADMTAAPPATSGACSYGSNADGDGILEVSETISRLNQSNYCANTEVGEPELGSVVCVDQIASTVWYKFTTGTIAAPITVRVWDDGDAGGSDDIDPYFSVYKSCVGCTFGTNLVQVGEAGGTDVLGGAEADDYSITFNPAPSSTYYIQVGGWVDGALCGNSEKGDFNVSASMAATALKGDYICDAHIAGSTGWSETGGTNNDLLDLGETMQTTSVFTNKGFYSVEDGCGLDEPDNSDGDETVWFKFKTSGTVGSEIAVNVDAVNGSGEGAACPGGVGTTFA